MENKPEHNFVQVIDRTIENGVVQPLHFNSVNQEFKERKSQKLEMKRIGSQKSYLVGKRFPQDNY